MYMLINRRCKKEYNGLYFFITAQQIIFAPMFEKQLPIRQCFFSVTVMFIQTCTGSYTGTKVLLPNRIFKLRLDIIQDYSPDFNRVY